MEMGEVTVTSNLPPGCATRQRETKDVVNKNTLVAEPRYHNCSPSVWLIGHASEAMVMEMTALVDTGSQISALTEGSCSDFGLRILSLGGLVHLEGIGVFQYHTRDT